MLVQSSFILYKLICYNYAILIIVINYLKECILSGSRFQSV